MVPIPAVPLTSAEAVLAWGPTLVIAPHADDESLGCGGAIALLRGAGIAVEIVWLTDGTKSHPHSRSYPAPRLAALREAEAHAAAEALGVPSEHRHFLRLPDAAMPALVTPEGQRALGQLRALLAGKETVLVTWRGDPHCDHRDAYALAREAVRGSRLRLIEYPIWVWENGLPEDAPASAGCEILRVDIAKALPRKQRAIAAHQSQVTDLIHDDPEGFRVPETMLEHFQQPWELFISAP